MKSLMLWYLHPITLWMTVYPILVSAATLDSEEGLEVG